MLAAHADQENIVASHQAAAAAKPLNHGLKGLAARTPAPKAPNTPFRVPLNDENGAARAAKGLLKAAGKGAENQLLPTGKKGAPASSNAFVTPAGPRAPLGMKTTNAKAAAFATPAPKTVEPGSEKTGAKSSGPRQRRAKVKVHQASPAIDVAQDEERDIEYMPPREVPLPDDPEDWPSDMAYPMFEGKNLVRGIYQTYYDPVDDDGVHLSDKRHAEQKAKASAKNDALIQKSLEETLGPLTEEERDAYGFPPAPKPVARPQPAATRPASAAGSSKPAAATRRPLSAAATTQPSAVTSRTVASALSSNSNPTASMRAHARSRSALSTTNPAPPASVAARKKPVSTTETKPANPSGMRHQAATAASRTTLGYGKGRAVSTSVRQPLGAASGNQQRPASRTFNAHSRSPSTANARPSAPARSRSVWARHDSRTTLTSPMADDQVQDENDAEMDMLREMALRNLTLSDGLDGDDWFSQAQAGVLGSGIGDDEEEEFQFTLPTI